MAKKSQRHPRPPRCEKDQSGCMWSLISIFDFRQGRFTRKLLSDRKHGSGHAVGVGHPRNRLGLLNAYDEMCHSVDDGDKSKIPKLDGGKRSVKKLIEEEMSNEQDPKQQISNATVEHIQPNSKNENHLGKNHKQKSKTHNRACDTHVHDLKDAASLESQQPHHPNSVEQFLNDIGLAAVMEEFCNQIYQSQEAHLHHVSGRDSCDVQESISCVKHNQLDDLSMRLNQKHSDPEEKLIQATEALLIQKFIEAKQHTKDAATHQSKQFMDALDILDSNKELFLKLLKDRNSLLVKHIQDQWDAQAEVKRTKSLTGANLSEKINNSRQSEELLSHKQFQKPNMHNFFRRKSKCQDRNPSKGNDTPQALNRIVVLKPGPEDKQNSGTEIDPSSSSQSRYSLIKEGQSVRITPHFSLAEITRKLKHVGESRKEKHWIPTDGISHKVPYKRQDSEDGGKGIARENSGRDSASKNYFPTERIANPSINTKQRDKIGKSKDCAPSIRHKDAPTSVDSHKNLNMKAVENSKQRESNIYVEAKKHLADMMSTGNEVADLLSRQIPRTLGCPPLSLPEYNSSPVFSPGRDREHSFVTAKMRFSSYDDFQMASDNMRWIKQENNSCHHSPLRQNIDTPSWTNDKKPDKKQQISDLNSDVSEFLPDTEAQGSTCSAKKELSSEGDVKVIEITDIVCPEENNLLDMTSEPNSGTPVSRTNSSTDTTRICVEERSSECLRLDSPEENQPSSSSLGPFLPSSLLIQKTEDLEGFTDKSERPSPISVLEPFVYDDVVSPASTISQPVQQPIQPLPIQFKEHNSSALVLTSDPETCLNCMDDKQSTFEYVKSVLHASGLSWDEFLGRCHSSDQLLDPSLFDEVEILSGQHCDDQKPLFDCINEVLVEVYERYFGCSPWVSFVKPNIRPVPEGKNLIREVWEGIDWHLLPLLPPRTLDQIVGRDMDKAGTWMELRFNIESIGTETGNIILDELMEDIIYELCT